MNPTMDHERCSELLRPFVDGALDRAAEAEVRAHLDSCEQCTIELEVVRRLIAPETSLTEDESRNLRRQVLAAIDTPEPQRVTEVVPLRARRWNLGQALGVAALLVVGVVFVANYFGGAGGSDEATSADGAGVASEAGNVADIRDSLSFRRGPSRAKLNGVTLAEPDVVQAEKREAPAEDAGGDDTGTVSGGGSASTAGGSEYKGGRRKAVRPLYVRGAGRLNDRRLTLIGRFGLPLVLFPRAFTGADALKLQEDFLIQLANAAETDSNAKANQVIECGAQVISRPDPVLPALATFGRAEGKQVFVLAFAWAESEDAPVDHYMVWTWPAFDCDALPTYRAGSIGK